MIKAEWTNKDSLDLQPTCNRLATTEGDLISREAVLSLFPNGFYSGLASQIKSLPSATCDDCIWHVCNYNKIDWDGEDGYISKQDAIDAIEETDWYHINRNGEMVHGSSSEHESWYKCDDIFKAIKSIPSAEPKREECEEREQGLCPFYAG